MLKEENYDYPRIALSVAFSGHRCALLLRDRVTVIDWDSGAVIDQRRLHQGPGQGYGRVRTIDVAGRTRLVGLEGGVLSYDQLRPAPPLRTTPTAVPRTWTSVAVGQDSGAVLGLDDQGVLHALASPGHPSVMPGEHSTSTPAGDNARLGSLPGTRWRAVTAGRLLTFSHFAGVLDDGRFGMFPFMPDGRIEGRIDSPGGDQVTGLPQGGVYEPESLFGFASGAVAGPRDDQWEVFWREDGPIRALFPMYGRALVIVDRGNLGEHLTARVRDTATGRLLAERYLGAVGDADVL